MTYINIVFEDFLSEAVIKKLLAYVNKDYYIGMSHNAHGAGWIKKNINGFNKACKGMPYFILVDSDRHCPVTLIEEWLIAPLHRNMLFRIAVSEIESWILADRQGFASFLGVSADRIPAKTDEISDAKRTLIDLARLCRHRDIRDGIVPKKSSTATIGQYYNEALLPFVIDKWDIAVACQNSDSLSRALRALERFEPLLTGAQANE